jgi:hypothetical protein
MKTITTIALLFFGISFLHGQYFNGSEQWHARIYGEIYTKNFYSIGGQRIHYFDGQSTINGKSYRNLRIERKDTTYYYLTDAVFASYEVDELVGYLREEGSQVYFIFAGTNNEVLLYDFDLAVGDWIEFGGCYFQESHEVTSISTIDINGQERKVFHFEDLDFDLVEGIGWTEGPLDDGCQDSSFQFNELVCFQKDNSNFSFTENVDCALVTSTTAPQRQESVFSLFPNPVHSTFQIQFEGTASSTVDLELYDITGKLVASWEQLNDTQQYNIRHLPKGIYIVQLSSAGIPLSPLRIVKH